MTETTFRFIPKDWDTLKVKINDIVSSHDNNIVTSVFSVILRGKFNVIYTLNFSTEKDRFKVITNNYIVHLCYTTTKNLFGILMSD